MLSFKVSGSFRGMEAFGKRIQNGTYLSVLEKYGPMGVAALRSATPVESSETANSWTYKTEHKSGYFAIHWMNTHENHGTPIAIILQYGHGTGTGGYVQGRDYINPAMRPIFDQMADEMWKEVTK